MGEVEEENEEMEADLDTIRGSFSEEEEEEVVDEAENEATQNPDEFNQNIGEEWTPEECCPIKEGERALSEVENGETTEVENETGVETEFEKSEVESQAENDEKDPPDSSNSIPATTDEPSAVTHTEEVTESIEIQESPTKYERGSAALLFNAGTRCQRRIQPQVDASKAAERVGSRLKGAVKDMWKGLW